tara:strand:- start:1079 stop:2122 length:1044 start_codon:yes stop_codon:yes gene_type:complete
MSILDTTSPRSVARDPRPGAGVMGGFGRGQRFSPDLSRQVRTNQDFSNTAAEKALELQRQNQKREAQNEQLSNLYGLKYENWAEADVDRFAKHRDVFADKVKEGYYDEEAGNGGYSKFLEDLESFNLTYDKYSEAGGAMVVAQRSNLQSAITNGLDDNNFVLNDDVDSLAEKDRVFDLGGVDTEGQVFNEETMQWEGYYTDLQGNRIIEDGKEAFGPVLEAPTRGDRALYMPSLSERGGMDPSDVAALYIDGLFSKVNPIQGAGGDLEQTLSLIRSSLIEKMNGVDGLQPADPHRNAVKTANDEFGDREPVGDVNAYTEYADKVMEQLRLMYNNKTEAVDPYNPANR